MPQLHESIAQYYHERTKYDPETIAAKNQGLDWDKQPVPFKEYKIGTTFDLKPHQRRTRGICRSTSGAVVAVVVAAVLQLWSDS